MHGLRWKVVVLASMLLAFLGGGAAAEGSTDDQAEPVSILFVGNSLTYFNGGIDSHVAGLAASDPAGMTLEVDASTAGGASLWTHWYLGVANRIRKGSYDIVVLQEDFPAIHGQTEQFLEPARLLEQVIADSGARTVFFMTWPFEEVDWVGLDDIVAAHRRVEEELATSIVPAGIAMARAQAERPDLALIVDTRGHPSAAGTYLAAATNYATLSGRSPEGLPYRMEGVSDEDAAFLQRVAWEVVQEWRDGSPAEG